MGNVVVHCIIGFPHPIKCRTVNGRGYLCCPGTFRSQSGRAKLLYQAPLLKLVREAGSRTGAFSTRNWRATFILLPAEIGGLSESRTLPKDITNPYAAATPIAPSEINALTILTLAWPNLRISADGGLPSFRAVCISAILNWHGRLESDQLLWIWSPRHIHIYHDRFSNWRPRTDSNRRSVVCGHAPEPLGHTATYL